MKYVSIIAIFLFCMSCNSKQKEAKEGNIEKNQSAQIKTAVVTIDQLMVNAEELVGKEVHFTGLVNHVCAHSGKRCILKNLEGNLSIRVEASGNLEGFDKEMAGQDITVSGILREKRLEEAAIDEWETEVKAKDASEDGGKHCSSEMANIKEMRDWMKENNKNYYAIYYVDGNSYEVVE
ncbi:hypothetical protein BZG01_12160 [Labilibaculum manganireducens]|uniref:DUF4920 domain-containing protein n=1 Tax=Labilibaculum manganireducens TaxID=1940525 RepID=A0A2N3I725_9BACT|nr:hypothetical protein [Labilibaculum manganireducens]PKQ66108.1 hypothetical protein BZG01_12160 [Labilibaculum manganireducens]